MVWRTCLGNHRRMFEHQDWSGTSTSDILMHRRRFEEFTPSLTLTLPSGISSTQCVETPHPRGGVMSGDSPFLSSSPAFNTSRTPPVTVSIHTPLSALSFGPTLSPQTAPVLCPLRPQVAGCHLLPFAFASICLRVFDRSADVISSDLPPCLRSFRDVIRCHLLSFASGF